MSVDPLEIRTDRLLLWVPGAGDAARLLRFHQKNDAHLGRWAPPAEPGWRELGFWQRRLGAAGRDGALRMVISARDDADRRVVGTISLTAEGELGYALAEEAQGRGWMIEAVRAISAHALGARGHRRVIARYHPGNVRSARVLQRAGYVVVGVASDHVLAELSHVTAASSGGTRLPGVFGGAAVRPGV